MKTNKAASPFRWPFPPPSSQAKAPVPRSTRRPAAPLGAPSRKNMLADVVMVMLWGASIPGLMWLGAAGGF